DGIEGFEVRDRIRSGRPADRRLVHEHGVSDELDAFELAEGADALVPRTLRALDRRVEHVVHERRLARAADAGDDAERVERNGDLDVLEVVLARAGQLDLLAGPAPPRRRNRNR